MAVTGLIHPDKVRTSAAAQAGDMLILITNWCRDFNNKTAAEIMASYELHVCTDVTGFGLLGHASEMAKGSGLGLAD